jgi:hypothetical protein
MAGHHQTAEFLHRKLMDGGFQQTANLLPTFLNSLNHSGIQDHVGNPLFLKLVRGYDILLGPTPAAVVLEGTDNGTGHAISLFRNYIIDSSWPLALPRTKLSLDWSCFPAEFKKPSLVYILVKRRTLQRKCFCCGFTCLCRGQPPQRSTRLAVPIPFPQDQTPCLASSFASVLHLAGHFQIAAFMHYQLENGEFAQGGNENRINSFTNQVNNAGIRDKLGHPMMLTRVKGYNMLHGITPAAVILEGTDRRHDVAISLFDNTIINSSWPVVLPRTKEALDWSCFPAGYKQPYVVMILVRRPFPHNKKT